MIVEVIAAVGAAVSAIVAAIALVYSVRTQNKIKVQEQKVQTMEAFNRLQREVLDKMNEVDKKFIESALVNNDKNEISKYSAYLARIEHFAVGVNSDIYDLQVVRRLGGQYMIGIYNKLIPLIEFKRKRGRNTNLYNEFERMIKNLKETYKGETHGNLQM